MPPPRKVRPRSSVLKKRVKRVSQKKKTISKPKPAAVAPKATPKPPAPVTKSTTPFNADPECATYVKKLLTDLRINMAVETGTFHGTTTQWLARHIPKVHTVEISEHYRNIAMKFFQKECPNIKFHLGNSPSVLQKVILPNISSNDRVVYYLDAHWNQYWPILDELNAIATSSSKNNCLIIIDDFQIPDHPHVPYDRYKGQALNYDYIKTSIHKVFDDIHYEYYIPVRNSKRGRFVAYPRAWKLDEEKIE
jgi:predicted O-methyltransferase YrrM